MNKESANSMLKFLEEPTGTVYGFFITNHISNVIPTIQSRCEIIDVSFANDLYDELGLNKDEYYNILDIASDYIIKIEKERKDIILYNNDITTRLEKERIRILFQLILNIYNNSLVNREMFTEKYNNLSFLLNYSKENIIKKVSLVIEFLRKINYNVNIDLLLDKFVIEMDGINNESL